MSKFQEVQAENILRRERIIEGKYNCIPFPFKRFRKVYPGVEQGKYILISANQKIGKSKLADFLFIYEPLFYMMDHPELKVKVLYFSLEMSAKEKYNEFLCHLLSRLDKMHIGTRELKSVDRPCDPHIFELLESERYQKYIKAYEDMVIFNDSDKNPTGIRKFYRNYALEHGHYNYITIQQPNDVTGEIEERKVLDPIKPYSQDDEDEYRIIILDNAANIEPEKNYTDRRSAIEKVSKDGIVAKKQLNYIFVLIQHQAQSQEGIENFKLDRMMPTADGLGDNKTIIRDINAAIGLYNPAKFGKKSYMGYDTERLKNCGRFMNIIDDRDYGAGGNICPLFFDGATSTFKELPKVNEREELEKYYRYAEFLDSREQQQDFQLTNPK